MKKTSRTILFFGSGPVAAKSLELAAKHLLIEAVVTKPRPAHHRGPVPVLEVADSLGLPVHTVTNKLDLSTLITTVQFKSELALLIDFGIIVPQKVIDYFPLGIVNSHFSLLPEWRGADPITFSILSGQKRTGISLMLLTAGMDEGPLLAQSPYVLSADITTPQLTEELIMLSDDTLQQVLPLYIAGKAQPVDQLSATMAESTVPTYSRKLTKHDAVLDFTKPAEQLEREIRAYLEWPRSRTAFSGLQVVITKARVLDAQGEPSTRTIIDREPVIYCGEKALIIEGITPAGKHNMSGKAFLAGYTATFTAS